MKSGTPKKRPVVPTTRVTFAPGRSGQILSVQIPAGERVRYVVGARGGQRLTAIANVDEVSLRLLEDAQVTPGPKRLAALLPKTGDYTLEIENTSASDIGFTLSIYIN